MTPLGRVEAVERPAELEEMLRSRHDRRLHLVGSASRFHRLPVPPPGAVTVRLDGMNRIRRLEPDDLTCSVEPGLSIADLETELEGTGVELPCAAAGTLGGWFAADPLGALTPGGPSPRSVLLGIEGLLADGTPFRSGARVVKSVAGYDLHKLFVGSRGKLFAVTQMHLKLRKAPRSRARFCRGQLDALQALQLFHRLRREAVPPALLLLSRDRAGFAVAGRFEGRPAFVTAGLARLDLPAAEAIPALELEPHGDGVVVAGALRPSRLPALLELLPEGAPLRVTGGGRFQVALSGADCDRILPRLPEVPAPAEVLAGDPGRRGRHTPLDPGAERLGRQLEQALDPQGVLV